MTTANMRNLLGAAGALALLSGCVSIGGGGEAPDQLLTLTPTAIAPAGASATGDMSSALAVSEPAVPHSLDVVRIPVRVNDSSIAYLQDAFWVEKPARLFQRVLAETIRANSERLVVGGGDLEYAARTQLGGELVAMGYDASTGSVVVRYDAVLRLPDGEVRTQRFESEQSGVAPDALSVGPALNRAANDVAAQVAEWVG
ncbi:ABC transporter [Alteraurantiacibacter aquimixticola]|uniref:ABC transporter n=2 Tax=Alteraurantiacibacter aquimixticola TaxID=2489173 RepID=A0A4T3F4J5_9SPHN|nr:ABC transporter [Alteraurantiacibacter aquimixticola]